MAYVESEDGSLCPYFGGNLSGCFNQQDINNMRGCFDYYLSRCVPYYPSDTCQSVPSDTLTSGGMEFTPAVVDSVMAVFNLGFKGGLYTYLPFFGGAVAVLVVIHLLSYSVSKS